MDLLWEITQKMKSGFEARGYDTGPTETPIIPVIIGDDEKAFLLWKFLREDGVFTNPVIYPAVPEGQSLIRASYSATHSEDELDTVLAGFEKCSKLLGVIR
jgi:7-keto-8-aminopelargonate synthetase-like enzyme